MKLSPLARIVKRWARGKMPICTAGSSVGKWKGSRFGFTLLELLVALALVGLMLGVAIPWLGNVMDLLVKRGARRLAGTIQYLYGKAVTQRLTIRLVYSFEKQTYWAEASRDRFLLVKEEISEL